MSTIAWPEQDWVQFYKSGSGSAVDYRSAFLAGGSGGAGLSIENDRLNKLAARAATINRTGGYAPSQRAISAARKLLRGIYQAATLTSISWASPHIAFSDDAEVAFEWWSEQRKITLYVGDQTVEYIKVWGPNIDNQMELGELKKADTFRELWSWLGGVAVHGSYDRR